MKAYIDNLSDNTTSGKNALHGIKWIAYIYVYAIYGSAIEKCQSHGYVQQPQWPKITPLLYLQLILKIYANFIERLVSKHLILSPFKVFMTILIKLQIYMQNKYYYIFK